MTVKLSNLLFFEKKEKALNLVKMLDYGMLPSAMRRGKMMPIKSMTHDVFVDALETAAKSDKIAIKSGVFSSALIDFGDGPVECVIKVGTDNADAGFKYLYYCQEKGGRSYCTGFPDIYYLNSFDIQNGTINVAIMEYVYVNVNTPVRFFDIFYGNLLHHPKWSVSNPDSARIAITDILAQHSDIAHWFQTKLKWSEEDVVRFFIGIATVGGELDIHGGNLGLRDDGSVCVFDPLSYAW